MIQLSERRLTTTPQLNRQPSPNFLAAKRGADRVVTSKGLSNVAWRNRAWRAVRDRSGVAQMQDARFPLRILVTITGLEIRPEQALIATFVVNDAGRSGNRVGDDKRVAFGAGELPFTTQITGEKRHFRVH